MDTFAPDSPQLARLVRDTRDNPPNGRPDGWTRSLAIGRGALAALPAVFAEAFPGGVPVLIADHDTWEAAGPACEAALIAAGHSPRRLILEPRAGEVSPDCRRAPHPVRPDGTRSGGDDHLVCEDGVIRALAAILGAEAAAVGVAIGAGTVNDIVKHASHQLGRDYLAVPTAASMNGYTSTIAAVLVGGVKRTLPSRQPRAIVADIDVIASAPAHLNRAGFGDLLSKPVSQGDWLLSHYVRGVPYDEAPNAIIDALFSRLLDEAAAIGRGEPAGLRTLMEAILVSGYSMALAGSSAPASGGEHLVSHYWDMEQLTANAPLLGLHGTQVGVATRLSARLFSRLLALDPATIDPAACAARKAAPLPHAAFAALHPRLDAATVAEIQAQLARKQRHGAALADELASVKARWAEITGRIRLSFLGVERLERALREAGCVTRASELGCDLPRLVHTLVVSRQIRDRYVAFDLLDDLGLLAPWAAEVAAETEHA